MATNSSIEWTTHTFNPWWGCTKVTDGCKFCYAETLSNRYGHDVWGRGRPRRLMSDNHWREPIRWNNEATASGERARVFCASMADVFDEEAPVGQLERLWELIRETPNLDWQILTKRPQRIQENLPDDWADGYRNVWLGTSVEDMRVIGRINHLCAVPARIRFLSIEPLIGQLTRLPLRGIHWVIVGGESGPGARPMNMQWVRFIRQRCRQSNVAYFFKQTGKVLAREYGLTGKGGHLEEMNNLPLELLDREMPNTELLRIERHGQIAVAHGEV